MQDCVGRGANLGPIGEDFGRACGQIERPAEAERVDDRRARGGLGAGPDAAAAQPRGVGYVRGDGVVRRVAVAGLEEAAATTGRRRGQAVGAIDETGQVKAGTRTAGVKRQYLGCVGKVASGINTVHLAYVQEQTGHALVGAQEWIPAGHIGDPATSAGMDLPGDLVFRTKGQVAFDQTAPPEARLVLADTRVASTRMSTKEFRRLAKEGVSNRFEVMAQSADRGRRRPGVGVLRRGPAGARPGMVAGPHASFGVVPQTAAVLPPASSRPARDPSWRGRRRVPGGNSCRSGPPPPSARSTQALTTRWRTGSRPGVPTPAHVDQDSQPDPAALPLQLTYPRTGILTGEPQPFSERARRRIES